MQNIRFIYRIDKETAFIYWAQKMVEWNWNFEIRYRDYFIDKFGDFNDEENKALNKLKDFLQEDNNGYDWLWKNYTNTQKDSAWMESKAALQEKFDKIWDYKVENLESWKEYLESEQYDHSLNKHIPSLHKFFDVEDKQEIITIYLLPTYEEKTQGSAAAKKGFKSILLEGGPFTDRNKLKKRGIIWHEFIHILFNRSSKEEIIKEKFREIIKPKKIEQTNPSWKYLVTESLVFSIAGEPFSYLDGDGVYDEESIQRFHKDVRSGFFHNQIMLIGSKISELTKEYLDNNKEMDSNYIEEVLNTWLSYHKSK